MISRGINRSYLNPRSTTTPPLHIVHEILQSDLRKILCVMTTIVLLLHQRLRASRTLKMRKVESSADVASSVRNKKTSVYRLIGIGTGKLTMNKYGRILQPRPGDSQPLPLPLPPTQRNTTRSLARQHRHTHPQKSFSELVEKVPPYKLPPTFFSG